MFSLSHSLGGVELFLEARHTQWQLPGPSEPDFEGSVRGAKHPFSSPPYEESFPTKFGREATYLRGGSVGRQVFEA